MKKVLAGGRFNIIHAGHIYFLKKAKSLGDFLVVVIANDRTVKNQGKKIFYQERIRKSVVESIKFVDRAVIGYPIKGQDGYIKIVKDERPNVIALGYDQKINIPFLKQRLRKIGIKCKIKRISQLKGFETNKILKLKNKQVQK